jgi:hypothetical protein
MTCVIGIANRRNAACIAFAMLLLSSRDFPDFSNQRNAVGPAHIVATICLGKYIEKYGQAARTISIGQLNILLYLHFQPINQVVSLDPLVGLCLRDVSS